MLGICLKYEQKNYGSKLQALATVKMLEELGLEYEILCYHKDATFYLKSLPRFFNWVFLNDRYDQIQKKLAFRKHPEIAQQVEKRKTAFFAFDEQYRSDSQDDNRDNANYDYRKASRFFVFGIGAYRAVRCFGRSIGNFTVLVFGGVA